MYCGSCGSALAPDAKFCGQCGAPSTPLHPAKAAVGSSPIPPAPSLVATPALPVQSVVAPSPRLSLWLAGFLECLVPGVGLLYAGSLVAGALVLGFTLTVGCLLLFFGLALVPHARPAARERYFLVVGAMLLAWLIARVVWAVGAAMQRNAAPPASTPSPPAHLTPGRLYGPPGPTPR